MQPIILEYVGGYLIVALWASGIVSFLGKLGEQRIDFAHIVWLGLLWPWTLVSMLGGMFAEWFKDP